MTQTAIDNDKLLREYIAGGQVAALAAIRQCLPRFIDDITRDFGSDVYDRMLTDPIVSSAVDQLKLGVMADGIRFAPAIEMPSSQMAEERMRINEPEKYRDALRARELCEFVERSFKGSRTSAIDAGGELLDGLVYGNKVAEVTLRLGTGMDSGKYVLDTIKGKHRSAVAFVVDEFMNVLGIQGIQPNSPSSSVGWFTVLDDKSLEGLVPRYKVAIYANNPKDGDPRGNSILRPAYLAWFLKTQVLPEFFKYLKQFASPGMIGKTAVVPGGDLVQKTDANGELIMDENMIPVLITAEQALYNAMMTWMNASVLVVRGGTEIDFLESKGEGQAFLAATDYFDRQIHHAILGTDGMTMGAKNDSSGAKQIGQDVVGLRTAHCRGRLGNVITSDVIVPLIRVNFGEDDLRLAPSAVLSSVEQQDWAGELDALSNAFARGFIHESQLEALDDRLGLPPRDMEAMAAERADKSQLAQLAAGNYGKLIDPMGGQPDPKEA